MVISLSFSAYIWTMQKSPTIARPALSLPPQRPRWFGVCVCVCVCVIFLRDGQIVLLWSVSYEPSHSLPPRVQRGLVLPPPPSVTSLSPLRYRDTSLPRDTFSTSGLFLLPPPTVHTCDRLNAHRHAMLTRPSLSLQGHALGKQVLHEMIYFTRLWPRHTPPLTAA